MQRIRGRKNFRFQIRNIHSQRDCSQLTEKYRQYPITSGIFLAGRKVVPSLIIRAVTERGVLVPLVNLSSLFYTCSLFIFQRYFGPLKRNEPRAKLWVVALISNNYARARNHCETRTLPVARPSRFNGGNNLWKSPTPWGILRGISWCFGLKMRI